MNIHKSAEDYLEMILRLQESQEYVRAVDISVGLPRCKGLFTSRILPVVVDRQDAKRPL